MKFLLQILILGLPIFSMVVTQLVGIFLFSPFFFFFSLLLSPFFFHIFSLFAPGFSLCGATLIQSNVALSAAHCWPYECPPMEIRGAVSVGLDLDAPDYFVCHFFLFFYFSIFLFFYFSIFLFFSFSLFSFFLFSLFLILPFV